MGAARPQTPRRSPRRRSGGTLQCCLRQAERRKENFFTKSLNDYMPAIRGPSSDWTRSLPGLDTAQILDEMRELEADDLKACLVHARRRLDHPLLAA